MIVLMNRDTCKFANVDESLIVKMDELSEEIAGRAYPYTRLHLIDKKQNHDYFLNVVESVKQIMKLSEEAKEREEQRKKLTVSEDL